jgi:hypothetical protein
MCFTVTETPAFIGDAAGILEKLVVSVGSAIDCAENGVMFRVLQ